MRAGSGNTREGGEVVMRVVRTRDASIQRDACQAIVNIHQ